jgi:hypothetical protein
VVYAKEGQSTCKEFWENEHGSMGFERFLSLLGDRVKLKGWNKFRGGLDVHNVRAAPKNPMINRGSI